jgi:hypothetical protein
MKRLVLSLLLACPLSLAVALAQQVNAPEPVVKVTIYPPRVVVGQQTTLHIDVLAPNYMTSPPELPDFQVRNAVTRPLPRINTSEQRDGITYAGVRFDYALYPQEPGTYAIAGENVRIRYAAEPPATREAVIALPRISFEAFVPDAANDLAPFVSANTLAVEQTVKQSSDRLKAGDAVTRTVTITAEGTPAMLLPPQQFDAVEGLRVYPAQPTLDDKTSSRSDLATAVRLDSATYMIERPGDYLLPAIDVRWWNVSTGKIELAHLDAVALQVAASPAAQNPSAVNEGGARGIPEMLFDFVVDHWLFGLLALAALALLAWFAPRAWRSVVAVHRRRYEARLKSEAYFFDRLRQAARREDPRAAYFALLDWLQRFEPAAPLHSVESLKAAADDPTLDREIDAIERQLFASRREAADWSPRQLLRRLSTARRTLRRQSIRGEQRRALPERINPVTDAVAPYRQWRTPAR